jgi:hypothetical protein
MALLEMDAMMGTWVGGRFGLFLGAATSVDAKDTATAAAMSDVFMGYGAKAKWRAVLDQAGY